MTDYGMIKGAICELLHCSLSELASRCPKIQDEEFAAMYLIRKAEEEEKGVRGIK